MKHTWLIPILALLLSSRAQAVSIIEVTPVVSLSAAAPTQTKLGTIYNWTGRTAVSFGLLAATSLFESEFDLEVGAVLLNQLSERGYLGTTLVQHSQGLHVPVIIRYNFDERMGIGFGAYGSFAKGNITEEVNATSTLTSYNTAGVHNVDYGLLFNARASISISPHFYFIIDGRYQHGLTNLANIPPGISGDILNTRSMQAYLGISYRFLIGVDQPSLAR